MTTERCCTCGAEKAIADFADNGHGGKMGECADCWEAGEKRYAEVRWIWEMPELKFCNSQSLLDAVIGLYGSMPPEKWWRVLGEMWSGRDNIVVYSIVKSLNACVIDSQAYQINARTKMEKVF